MSIRRPAFRVKNLYLAALVFLCGCGDPTSIPAKPLAPRGTARDVYVTQAVNLGVSNILRFATSSSGVVQPAGSLILAASLSFVQSVTVDSHGHIYVAGRNYNVSSEIVEYAAGSSGSSAPIRTLSLSSFSNLGAMITDETGNLYVGADNEIAVFDTSGSTTPARVIGGNLTQLIEVDGIAVDAQGAIYVTNVVRGPGSVLVFGPGAAGNVAPTRTITGIGTSPLYDPSGIATDGNGNLFISGYTAATGPASVFELAPNASGSPVPLKTISGPRTGFGTDEGIGSLDVDGSGNLYIVVITPTSSGSPTLYFPSVSVFSPTATGNAAPASSFSSPAWTLPGYGQSGVY